MSSLYAVGFNPAKAAKYNANSTAVGWHGNIPQAAIDLVPDLVLDSSNQHGTERFAQAVWDLQCKVLGLKISDCDGKFGNQTWMAVLKKLDPVPTSGRYYVHHDRRISVDREDAESSVICFDDPDRGLDLHRVGHFSRRTRDIKYLVLHWGGRDPKHLYRVFNSKNRRVSSHFGVGRGEIYQYLDLRHRAWHAGVVNNYSVGIDICQQPTTDFLDHYRDDGYDVREIDNFTDRGRKRILSLDPKIATSMRELVFDLLDILDIPALTPRNADGSVNHDVHTKSFLQNEFRGVIGHHHVSAKKWDMACWWDAIFSGTALE